MPQSYLSTYLECDNFCFCENGCIYIYIYIYINMLRIYFLNTTNNPFCSSRTQQTGVLNSTRHIFKTCGNKLSSRIYTVVRSLRYT